MIDDATLSAIVAAWLRLRLLILDEALQTLADQLHDGVDDAFLLEVAVAAPAIPIVAVVTTMPMAAAVAAIVTIVAPVGLAAIVVIVAIGPVVPMVAVVPIVVVTASVPIVAAIAAAAAVLTSAFVTPGARAHEPLERLQSFEDLTPIVVSHGNPPSSRLPWPARVMQALSPMRRHPRNAIAIASARRTVLRERAERGTPHCPTTRG